MLKLSLTASGLLDKSRFDAWSRQKQAAIHKAVASGMQTGGKRGFSVPMAEWLRGPLRPVFEDTVLSEPDLLGLPYNRAALAGMLADHVAGRADRTLPLWTILSLALWNRRFLRH